MTERRTERHLHTEGQMPLNKLSKELKKRHTELVTEFEGIRDTVELEPLAAQIRLLEDLMDVAEMEYNHCDNAW